MPSFTSIASRLSTSMSSTQSVPPSLEVFPQTYSPKTDIEYAPNLTPMPCLKCRRYASFIATSSLKDLLTDPSGSRRFICIEVISTIDTSKAIDYGRLYGNLYENRHNERYWFEAQAEERIMTENNRDLNRFHLKNSCSIVFQPARKKRMANGFHRQEYWKDIKKNSAIPISNKRVSVFEG